ncbi:hypothetical protein ACHAXR_003001 [Thalassiosira sp. AJA248-18]
MINRVPVQQQHQTRMYHISLDKDSIDIEAEIDDATFERHNTLSRRLYRTLLRSCKHGVEIANKGNSIVSSSIMGSNNGTQLDDAQSWILLQPPMDQRKYGFAKIVQARRGKEEITLPSSDDVTYNRAASKMSKEDIGMAMEVLRFVHMSLGGSAEDDLEDYYLGCSNEEDFVSEGKEENEAADSSATAAAGRHAEGHYTQFIDEDEERGEGDDVTTPGDDWDSDDDEDDKDQDKEIDESVLVTSNDIQNAIKIAFRAPLLSESQPKDDVEPLSTIIARRHSDAINACSQLSEQFNMWGNKSSISIDWDRGVRVVATSSLMMRPASATNNYRFSYRVRVENIIDTIDPPKKKNTNKSEQSDESVVEHRAVQLLGRSWNISERGSSVRQRLFEKILTKTTNDNENDGDGDNELRVVQSLHEPRTGAGKLRYIHSCVFSTHDFYFVSYSLTCLTLLFYEVGHLPVLGPGEVFEYMSGADIATTSGAMEGCFHMASVDMQNTDSAHIGDEVEALHWESNDERIFEMPVGRFGFVVDEDLDT